MKSQRHGRSHPRSGFTPDEDYHLINLVAQYGKNAWGTIASYMEKRNARQCKDRYTSYLSPTINNGPYSQEEDDLLRQKYLEIGPKWVKISKFFSNRTDISIKCRWAILNRKDMKMKGKNIQSADENTIINKISSDNISNNNSSGNASPFDRNTLNTIKENNIIISKNKNNTKKRNLKKKNIKDSEAPSHRTMMTIRKRDKKHIYNYDDDSEEIDEDKFIFYEQKMSQDITSKAPISSNKRIPAPSLFISSDNVSLNNSPEPKLSNSFQLGQNNSQEKFSAPQKVENLPIFPNNQSFIFQTDNSTNLNSLSSFNSRRFLGNFTSINEGEIADNHSALLPSKGTVLNQETCIERQKNDYFVNNIIHNSSMNKNNQKLKSSGESLMNDFSWNFGWDIPIGENDDHINLFCDGPSFF